MEQNNQQLIQKPSLPIKTKIAARFIKILGIFLLSLLISSFIFGGVFCFWSMSGCPFPSALICRLTILSPGAFIFFHPFRYSNCPDAWPWLFGSSILLIILSMFVTRLKRWALIISIIFLSAVLLEPFFIPIFEPTKLAIPYFIPNLFFRWIFELRFIYLFPLVSFLLDRKNFWKIAK